MKRLKITIELTPLDLTTTRFNVGIRSLEQGVTMTVTLYDPSGSVVKTTTKSFPPNTFVQIPVNDLAGAPARANSAVGFSVTEGSAFIYGAAVDNSGRSVTLQIATATPEI